MTEAGFEVALRPLAQALLSAAEADAARVTAEAARTSAEQIADARRQAEALIAEARRQGAADAADVQAAARARARREARGALLHTQRDLYDQLRDRARVAAAGLRSDPGYPRLRSRLAQAVWHALGGDAVVRDADGGGVIGEAAGRRLDLSLTVFADRAVEELAWQLFDGEAVTAPPAPGAPSVAAMAEATPAGGTP